MKRHRRPVLAPATLLVLALTAGDAVAQDGALDESGPVLGVTVGRLDEAWEGYSGSATMWTAVFGYQFNRRWALRRSCNG